MKRILAAAAIAVFFSATALAGENSEKSDEYYTAPSKSIQLSFDYGKFSQKGFPALKSDFGFAFSVYHSYWLWKPRSHRFQLGIDVAWTDINYYNYKINLRTFDGYTTRYTMHSGDIGLQVGCGVTSTSPATFASTPAPATIPLSPASTTTIPFRAPSPTTASPASA